MLESFKKILSKLCGDGYAPSDLSNANIMPEEMEIAAVDLPNDQIVFTYENINSIRNQVMG